MQFKKLFKVFTKTVNLFLCQIINNAVFEVENKMFHY